MPLDTSTYYLAHLRLDGRRWNELRRTHGQISTQAAADGSAYLELGNTKVICTVDGPTEVRGGQGGRQQQQQQQQESGSRDEATVTCEINIAGFSGTDRKRRGRGDRYVCPWLSFVLLLATPIPILHYLYPIRDCLVLETSKQSTNLSIYPSLNRAII